MGKAAIIKHNIKLLADAEPDVKDNYNLLTKRYWQKYDLANDIEDIVNCTPSESITRAFRSLVKSGDITLKEEIKKIRKREEKEFQKEYGGIC